MTYKFKTTKPKPTNITNEAAHDFNDSKATRFLFTKKQHYIFWREKGLGFLFLCFSHCSMRSFWITACRRKKNHLGHVFQDKFGIGFINQTVDEEKSGSPVDIGTWYTILFFVGFHVWQCRRIPFSKFLQLMRETCLLQHKGFLRVLLHP